MALSVLDSRREVSIQHVYADVKLLKMLAAELPLKVKKLELSYTPKSVKLVPSLTKKSMKCVESTVILLKEIIAGHPSFLHVK